MTRQKNSTSKSQKKSSTNSNGVKEQCSTGKSTKTTRSRSVQQTLDSNLEKLTSLQAPKKTGKSSGTKKPSRQTSSKTEDIKYTRSHKLALFPWDTFPWYLEDRKDNKKCWFECYDHAEKYIRRYKLTKLQYKLMERAV